MNAGTGIYKIEYCLPEKRLTNQDLAEQFDNWDAEKIYKKTGILERRICSEDETASDLAIRSSQKLFAGESDIKNKIDLLIYCTQSPDYFLPSTACVIQYKLGISKNCACFDVNLGCSGYIYCMNFAKAMIMADMAKVALVITADSYSKYINPKDKSTRSIFGDAAASTLVTKLKRGEGIKDTIMRTDGSGFANLIVRSGACRISEKSITLTGKDEAVDNFRNKKELYMNGPEIFQFTIRVIPELLKDIFLKSKLGMENIDKFVFHQANKYILDYLSKKLKISDSKMIYHLDFCGNTVSSSIPIALKEAVQNGQIKEGDTIALVGFGVGYSWGATIVKWRDKLDFLI